MAITGASEEVQVAIGGDASGLQEATDTATDALGNVKQAAGLAGAALGALAVGGLAKATQAAASFEESMVEVEKVTDPETAREMGDAIQEMASRMPVAQKELANITAQAGRFGIEGTENIEQFTETVSKMSVATDLSTQQAGESFARLSTLMDEPIENVGDMGNVINELSNTMATSSSEITDSALRSSGVLSQMGASSEDILSLNAAMNEASESAERAGTRLRRMAQEVQDPKKVEDLASALGMNVEQFEQMREEDPAALFQQMAQTMGEGGDASDALRSSLSTTSQQALTALSQNMEGLSEAQETANQQMEDGTSLQEEYESASSTFNSQLQVTKNRLRNVAIQIGENVLPVASEFLGYVNDAISAFSEWNDRSGGMVGTVALVAGALGGFAVAAASAVSALGGMSAILGAVGGALTILTGPVGLAIAAIALLAGAWKVNLFGIRDTTEEVLGFVRDVVGESLEEVREYWDENGEEIVETTTDAFGTVRNVINRILTFIWSGLIRPILRSIEQLWNRHGDALLSEARKTWKAVSGAIKTVLNILWSNIIRPVLTRIQSAWDKWGDEIMTIVSAIFGAVELIVTQAVDAVLTTIRVALALIRGDWGKAWDLVAGYLERTWARITNFLKGDALAGIKAAFSILIGGAKAALNYLIGTGSGTLLGDVKSVIGSIVGWVTGTGTDRVKGAISSLAEAVTGVFADTWNAALGGRSIEVPEVTIGGGEIAGQDVPEHTVGGGELGIPKLETGGRITDPGMFVGGERGDELVLNNEQTAEADQGGVTVGDVEEDVARALEQTDRTDDVTRKLDAVIRAIEESLDITIEMDDSGRYDAF